MRNYKFISEWLKTRDIYLAQGFAETLRKYARDYKKLCNTNLSEIYTLLGCSKQNVSYWENHCDSAGSGQSILRVVRSARDLFGLTDSEAEELANSAGLSLCFEGGSLLENLKYRGKVSELGANAMISERMLRHYKKNTHEAGSYGNCAVFGFES
ncbi:MAG: hypothetical protein K2N72_02590 [Oscillospiraceae bacterium]|nr:hypothetical protein [Oscillospiraceae bacterium]